ncbi:hypothetical protein JW992_04070 [candidate division KSB1 bacterium]|nr:hypothetical protein [candidate division KSB1 bacterium]
MVRFLSVLALLLAAVLSIACDSGLEPTRSGFRGRITFVGEKPADTDQVIVVAATRFPPTQIDEIFLGEPLPLDRETVDYTVYSPITDYAAIGVVWKQQNQPWDVTNIIGIYLPTSNGFVPGRVSIADRQTMVDSVDIQAHYSKVKRAVDSSVSGRLRASGQWPSDSESLLIFASTELIPSGLLDLQFGAPIPAPFDSIDYRLTIQPGTYRLFGVLLIRIGQPLDVSAIRGFYSRTAGSPFPSSVVVPTDTSRITGIDIAFDPSKAPFTASH